MKKISIKIITALVIVTTLFTVSCKKSQEFKDETGELSEENKNIQSSLDGAINDANSAVSNNSTINGRSVALAALTVCGATIDTTEKSSGILTLNFSDSIECSGRKRSGRIKASLLDFANGKRWKDAGAVLQLEYIDYKVVRTSDNASLIFNGTTKTTNVSGGNAVYLILGLQSSLIHTVSGNDLQVKFDDGKTATFNLARKFTHTYNAVTKIYEIKGEGEGSQGGLNNLENWGTTREGDAFTSQVLEPVVWNTTCGASKPVSGKLDLHVDEKNFNFTTTLGVDASGNVVSSGCPWGLKVEWKYKSKTGKKMYEYK